MNRTSAVIAGLALALLAGAAAAQWRDHGDRNEGMPRGLPPMGRDVRGGPAWRGLPQPHGPPQPLMRPPPGPIYSNDSLGAGWGAQQDVARAGVRHGHFVSLGTAIESVRRRGPGHELDAGLEQWNGRDAYRVRWAEPDGRRIDYMVDAVTGAILGVDEGH